MTDDFKVHPRSAKEIEALTLAWRDALGVPNDWAPNMLRLLEIELPKLPKLGQFALLSRSDLEMGDAEAYTQFNPPHIVVRNSVYKLARKGDGRSRMTLAHELGHLVMHPGASKLRSDFAVSVSNIRPYESAEWQANKFASLMKEICRIALHPQLRRLQIHSASKRSPDEHSDIRGLTPRPHTPACRFTPADHGTTRTKMSGPRSPTTP